MSTKISATTVADSICNDHRITTMLATFPRYILAEFNTHRMFSRNSASSRAIPFKKMVESVKKDPFVPIAWQKDHSGMQGTEYLSTEYSHSGYHALYAWGFAKNEAIRMAEELNTLGVTKQLCNRLLEPFMWHTVLVTATEWENFFALRCPQYNFELDDVNDITVRSRKDMYRQFPKQKEVLDGLSDIDWLRRNVGQADIHMMALAEAMWDAKNESVPKELKPGEWHMPFEEITTLGESTEWGSQIPDKVKIAVARAARTSYTVVGEEGKPVDYKKDVELHDRLLASGHMSPFEHCAQAMTLDEWHGYTKTWLSTKVNTSIRKGSEYGWCHNYRGWKSYRSMIPNESKI